MTRKISRSAGIIAASVVIMILSMNCAANQAPQLASAPTAVPNPAAINQSITFTAAATDADNDPLTYTWTFTDGFQGTGASIAHAFAVSGNFTATVTVTDGKGGTTSGNVAVMITDPATNVPLPPTVTVSGASVMVTPAPNGNPATGFRIHYNPTTDALRQFYKDSSAFSSPSGAAISVSASQLSNYTGGVVVASAFNASGESHYSVASNVAMTVPAPSRPRYSDVKMIYNAQCCCRGRCNGPPTGGVAPRFKSAVHYDITNQALGAVVNPAQLTSVIVSDIGVDIIFQTSTEYHFDAGNVNGAIANIQTQMAAAQANGLTASVDFGVACHPLQDFYSHTNFIENWLAINAARAATITDDQIYNELPALTGGDPTLMDKYYSGYFEGVTLLGGLGGTGGYSTYDLPSQTFITIYQDLETGEARPDGYKVGFAPWHGIINKDNEAQREGMSTITGQSMTLFAWAKRFATIHTKKLYDSLNQATKDQLSTAPSVSTTVSDQINNLIGGTSTATSVVSFGQLTTTLLRGSTHSGFPALSSLAVSLTKPVAGLSIKGDLSAQAFLACDVVNLGTLQNALLTGAFKRSTGAASSTSLGTIQLTGSSSFYFTNLIASIPIPGKGKPPFNAILRSAKIKLTGTLDNSGLFNGVATIQMQGGKGASAEKVVVPVQAQVSP